MYFIFIVFDWIDSANLNIIMAFSLFFRFKSKSEENWKMNVERAERMEKNKKKKKKYLTNF